MDLVWGKMMNKRQSKNKQSKKQGRRRAPRSAQPSLSTCAAHYAAAISDPFSNRALGACIPTFPQLRTLKKAFKSTFTMVAGSNGIGALSICPTAVNDRTLAVFSNDASQAPYSDSSTDVARGILGQGQVYTLSSYTADDFDTETNHSVHLSARVVSVGVRVQYIGSVTDMEGLLYAYIDPDNSNTNRFSLNQIASLPQTAVQRVTSQPFFVSCSGILPSDFTFNDAAPSLRERAYPLGPSQSFSTVDTSVGPAPIKIYYVGAVGAKFFVEVIQHFEIAGPGLGAAGTIGATDPLGFNAVVTANTKTRNELSGKSYSPSNYRAYFMDAVRGALAEMTPDPRSLGAGVARGAKALLGLGARRGHLALTL